MNLRYTGTLIIITSFSKIPSRDMDQSQWEEESTQGALFETEFRSPSWIYSIYVHRLEVRDFFFFCYTGSPNENLKKVIFIFTCNPLCLHLQEDFPESLAVAGVKDVTPETFRIMHFRVALCLNISPFLISCHHYHLVIVSNVTGAFASRCD